MKYWMPLSIAVWDEDILRGRQEIDNAIIRKRRKFDVRSHASNSKSFELALELRKRYVDRGGRS